MTATRKTYPGFTTNASTASWSPLTRESSSGPALALKTKHWELFQSWPSSLPNTICLATSWDGKPWQTSLLFVTTALKKCNESTISGPLSSCHALTTSRNSFRPTNSTTPPTRTFSMSSTCKTTTATWSTCPSWSLRWPKGALSRTKTPTTPSGCLFVAFLFLTLFPDSQPAQRTKSLQAHPGSQKLSATRNQST